MTRKQIQSLLGHTDKRRISAWLKVLREQQYIDWLYNPDGLDAISTPAIYFLSINGIRFLREQGYDQSELRKRYKDRDRQSDFMAQCVSLTNYCIHLRDRNNDDSDAAYDYVVEADYLDQDSNYSLLATSEHIRPSLAFTKTEMVYGEECRQTYLVELLNLSSPRYMTKKKIKGYIEYLASDEWEKARQEPKETRLPEGLPIVLIACPTLGGMIYTKRYARRKLDDMWDDNVPEEVKIRVSTIDKIKSKGVTAVIWEEI